MNRTLERLQTWYQAQCNGDWEHQYGVKIGTLDNPGWSVTIDPIATGLETLPFEVVEDRYDDEVEWLRCWVENAKFQCACGPRRLEDSLRVFLDWAENPSRGAV